MRFCTFLQICSREDDFLVEIEKCYLDANICEDFAKIIVKFDKLLTKFRVEGAHVPGGARRRGCGRRRGPAGRASAPWPPSRRPISSSTPTPSTGRVAALVERFDAVNPV